MASGAQFLFRSMLGGLKGGADTYKEVSMQQDKWNFENLQGQILYQRQKNMEALRQQNNLATMREQASLSSAANKEMAGINYTNRMGELEAQHEMGKENIGLNFKNQEELLKQQDSFAVKRIGMEYENNIDLANIKSILDADNAERDHRYKLQEKSFEVKLATQEQDRQIELAYGPVFEQVMPDATQKDKKDFLRAAQSSILRNKLASNAIDPAIFTKLYIDAVDSVDAKYENIQLDEQKAMAKSISTKENPVTPQMMKQAEVLAIVNGATNNMPSKGNVDENIVNIARAKAQENKITIDLVTAQDFDSRAQEYINSAKTEAEARQIRRIIESARARKQSSSPN